MKFNAFGLADFTESVLYGVQFSFTRQPSADDLSHVGLSTGFAAL